MQISCVRPRCLRWSGQLSGAWTRATAGPLHDHSFFNYHIFIMSSPSLMIWKCTRWASAVVLRYVRDYLRLVYATERYCDGVYSVIPWYNMSNRGFSCELICLLCCLWAVVLEAFLQLPSQLCLVSLGLERGEGQLDSMANRNRSCDPSASNCSHAELFSGEAACDKCKHVPISKFKEAHLTWFD